MEIWKITPTCEIRQSCWIFGSGAWKSSFHVRQILIKFVFPLNAQDPQQCFVLCEELFFLLCRKRVQDCTGIKRIFIIIYCVKLKWRAKLAAFQKQEATPICENGIDFCSCLFCSYSWLFCSRWWCWDVVCKPHMLVNNEGWPWYCSIKSWRPHFFCAPAWS